MDKLTVRKPTVDDLGGALWDLATLRMGPPLVMALAIVMVLTGSLVVTALSVVLTSLVHAFWARLVVREEG